MFVSIDLLAPVYHVTNGLLEIRMTSNAKALNMHETVLIIQTGRKGEDEAMICVSMAFMALWQASIET